MAIFRWPDLPQKTPLSSHLRSYKSNTIPFVCATEMSKRKQSGRLMTRGRISCCLVVYKRIQQLFLPHEEAAVDRHGFPPVDGRTKRSAGAALFRPSDQVDRNDTLAVCWNMADRTKTQFNELFAGAMAHHAAGRLREAEAAYRAALDISPGHPIAAHNLGVVTAEQGKHLSAIGHFDDAIAAAPRYPSAYYNRAVALERIGRRREAIQNFSRACAIEPEHYGSHRALGFLWLAEGERGRALDHFARTYELRRGDDRTGIADNALSTATRGKLLHDASQFRFLSERRRDGLRFEALARAYAEVAKDVPEDVTSLSSSVLDRLGDNYNTSINVFSAPEMINGAVNKALNRDGLIQAFKADRTGTIVVDHLLTPQALACLRRYLLESTIWHDFSHIRGFVASYLEDGLACPLLLQVAHELRLIFPELLRNAPLTQAWAFKGLESGAAIDIHADDAAVSVNFWVTPTQANLTPGHGGLVICRVPPPRDWEVTDYASDRMRIVAFLEQHAGERLVVPYQENRAVLFDSHLFHYSDAPQFAQGYENHRISVTLLYGRRDRDRAGAAVQGDEGPRV
jgi:tetratricopeptide (TPR) repeat protein